MEKPIKAVVVEDKEAQRKGLVNLLKRRHEYINVVAEAASVAQAFSAIEQHEPDLVFLDVHLDAEDLNAFTLLQRLTPIDFAVIFTTGHSEHLQRTHNLHLPHSSYLLKPITPLELDAEVHAAAKWIEGRRTEQAQAPYGMVVTGDRIALPGSKSHAVVAHDNILYCHSIPKDSGTAIVEVVLDQPHLGEGTYAVTQNLKEFEKILPNPPFMRIHKGWIVNTKHVTSIVPGRDGYLLMKNGTQAQIGDSFRGGLNDLWDKPGK